MRLLTAAFVERWKGRLVNIHPSLLLISWRACPPRRPRGRSDRKWSRFLRGRGDGHWTDHRPSGVPVLRDDTIARLAERVKAEEHRLYPRVLDAGVGTISFDAPLLP